MELRAVKIQKWPGELTASYRRKRSAFRSKWSDTAKLLDRELTAVSAKDVLIQLAIEDADLRLDGWIRATAIPRHPGVIVTFTRKGKALSFPCDRYQDWQDNVRAIALSLKALRDVDRHGVTQNGEQYQGWTALPDPNANGVEFTDKIQAAEFIANVMQRGRYAGEDLAAFIRAAEMKTHPDRGGDPLTFKKVQGARKALGL